MLSKKSVPANFEDSIELRFIFKRRIIKKKYTNMQKNKNTTVLKKIVWENWNNIYKDTMPEMLATIKSRKDTVIAPDLNDESPASCK
jgi:hypothetical protein